MKKAFDLGCQHGSQRKTKELLSWARKRRRHIRRDDLIAYLCGKTAPIRNHHHHHWTGNSLARTPTRVSVGMDRSCSPRHSGSLNGENKLEDSEPDLQPFRDALALQGMYYLCVVNKMGHTDSKTSSLVSGYFIQLVFIVAGCH